MGRLLALPQAGSWGVPQGQAPSGARYASTETADLLESLPKQWWNLLGFALGSNDSTFRAYFGIQLWHRKNKPTPWISALDPTQHFVMLVVVRLPRCSAQHPEACTHLHSSFLTLITHFSSLRIHVHWCFVCVHVYASCACLAQRRPEEGIGSSGAAMTDCEPPCGWRKTEAKSSAKAVRALNYKAILLTPVYVISIYVCMHWVIVWVQMSWRPAEGTEFLKVQAVINCLK